MDYKSELGKIYEYCTKHRRLNISDGDDFSRGESAALNKVQLLIKVVLKEAETSKEKALNIGSVVVCGCGKPNVNHSCKNCGGEIKHS